MFPFSPTSEEKNSIKVLSDHMGSYKALEFLSKKPETSEIYVLFLPDI